MTVNNSKITELIKKLNEIKQKQPFSFTQWDTCLKAVALEAKIFRGNEIPATLTDGHRKLILAFLQEIDPSFLNPYHQPRPGAGIKLGYAVSVSVENSPHYGQFGIVEGIVEETSTACVYFGKRFLGTDGISHKILVEIPLASLKRFELTKAKGTGRKSNLRTAQG